MRCRPFLSERGRALVRQLTTSKGASKGASKEASQGASAGQEEGMEAAAAAAAAAAANIIIPEVDDDGISNGTRESRTEDARLWHRLGGTMIVHYDEGSPLACTCVQLALMSDDEEGNGVVQRHDHLVSMERALITSAIDGEFELIRQRTKKNKIKKNEQEKILGIGVDDVFVDGREMDPLRLRDATDEQVHRWYDMTSAIMSHEFNRTTGTGQEW